MFFASKNKTIKRLHHLSFNGIEKKNQFLYRRRKNNGEKEIINKRPINVNIGNYIQRLSNPIFLILSNIVSNKNFDESVFRWLFWKKFVRTWWTNQVNSAQSKNIRNSSENNSHDNIFDEFYEKSIQVYA